MCSWLPGCRPAPCFRSRNEEESDLQAPSRTPEPLAQLSCLTTTSWSGECACGRCPPSHSPEHAPHSHRLAVAVSGPGCVCRRRSFHRTRRRHPRGFLPQPPTPAPGLLLLSLNSHMVGVCVGAPAQGLGSLLCGRTDVIVDKSARMRAPGAEASLRTGSPAPFAEPLSTSSGHNSLHLLRRADRDTLSSCGGWRPPQARL